MASSVWQLGFRPFFLLGAAHALVMMLLWLGMLSGLIGGIGVFDAVLWHSHEMIYGFTTAIIAGFVLTAAQNWTGVPGVKGRPLQALVLVWIAGRILVTIPGGPPALAAAVDLGFYPFLAYLMFPYLRDPELKAERVFYLLFALLFTGNLLVHLQNLGVGAALGRKGVLLGLDTVIVMIVFMGGRVIPFFTESSLARKQPKTYAWVEVASHASAALFLVAHVLFPDSVVFTSIAFLTASIHFIRVCGWQVPRVRRVPLIWVLHAGYLWLVIGFLLSALAGLGLVAQSPALHAFTVGGLGVIVYGMISRVSLGHTGRRLHPSLWMVVGYYLMNLSAAIRVFGPILAPAQYFPAVGASGVLWSASFVLYIVVYAPMLLAPRVDGRPG